MKYCEESKMEMPEIGLGTYKTRGEECTQAVTWALEYGYRHIDTASVYKNEEDVALGIEKSSLLREQIYLVSKLSPRDMKTEEDVYKACLQSLENLRTDYLDLYLCHWPDGLSKKGTEEQNRECRLAMWRVFERLLSEGKVRAIGVSNFTVAHLDNLLKNCKIRPAVNQVEFHPFLYQKELLLKCQESGIQLEAYASLGRADAQLLGHTTVGLLAQQHQKTPAQILLRWALDHKVFVIPKSTNRTRIHENFDVFDFHLNEVQLAALDSLNKNHRYCWDPTDIL